MRRFFSDSKNITKENILITDKEQIHHIKDVLRLAPDDEIVIVDEKGREYCSIIEKLLPSSVVAKIKNVNRTVLCWKTSLTIACALPKGQRIDDIIDKLSQLGVDRIIPMLTEHVVVKLDEHKKILRQRRWEKIALNSAKQSQRNSIMVIDSVKMMTEVLSLARGFDLKLIPTLTGKRQSLKEVFNKYQPKNILVFIGPEGDFSHSELELAKQSGCVPVSLGRLVLRVETAAVSVASFIRLYEDD